MGPFFYSEIQTLNLEAGKSLFLWTTSRFKDFISDKISGSWFSSYFGIISFNGKDMLGTFWHQTNFHFTAISLERTEMHTDASEYLRVGRKQDWPAPQKLKCFSRQRTEGGHSQQCQKKRDKVLLALWWNSRVEMTKIRGQTSRICYTLYHSQQKKNGKFIQDSCAFIKKDKKIFDCRFIPVCPIPKQKKKTL